jgi:two-component system, NarL family, invasion response regulator UvrY
MRIIIADHHANFRRMVRTLAAGEVDFDLVGEAVDTDGLFALAKNCPIDLALIDRELPGIHIEEIITRLHGVTPQPIIVVMSSEFEYSRMLLRAGADAFVSKSDQPDWLLDTLHKYARQVKMKDATHSDK